MADPVLVEATRGGATEIGHRGAVAVVDAFGKVVWALGEAERAVFPRSAVKALQALPLIETGAADRYGLTQEELALACSSHSGGPRHADAVSAILAKAGRDEACLECGTHWPMSVQASRQLAASGRKPTQLHNKCSGLQAGFICVACATDTDPKGYVLPDHPVQRRMKDILEELTDVTLADGAGGVDGCSIPAYAFPLTGLATAFARFGSGEKLSSTRGAAAKRLREAVAAEPFMVAGSGRFDTIIMGALGDKVFTKMGAEGVYCAALPQQGLGIALQCNGAAGRAAEAVMASLILAYVPLSDEESRVVASHADKPIVNLSGTETGRLRTVGELAARAKRQIG